MLGSVLNIDILANTKKGKLTCSQLALEISRLQSVLVRFAPECSVSILGSKGLHGLI